MKKIAPLGGRGRWKNVTLFQKKEIIKKLNTARLKKSKS